MFARMTELCLCECAAKEEFDKLLKSGQRVVVDLQFDDLMSEREVKSLVVQVCVRTLAFFSEDLCLMSENLRAHFMWSTCQQRGFAFRGIRI